MDNEKIHLLYFWSKNHMASGKLDLVIEKGATFKKNLYYKDSTKTPIDMTGYTARMQVRSSTTSGTVILELTTINGGIMIDPTVPATGKITLWISDTDTTAITFKGNAVYDLELVTTINEVVKLLRGTVSFHEEVTK